MRKLMACLVAVVATAAANAAPIIFQGNDPGVGPGNPRPNSNLAATSFAAAAGTLAPAITFEGLPNGTITAPIAIAPGVTASRLNANTFLAINPFSQNSVNGFNTTPGGSTVLTMNDATGRTSPQGVLFTFAAPIDSFGAYFTGVGSLSGTTYVLFDDGTQQQFQVPGSANGGASFFGFVDAGARISAVLVRIDPPAGGSVNDVVSIDDIRVRAAAVPEPLSIAVFGGLAAVGGLVARRRMGKVTA